MQTLVIQCPKCQGEFRVPAAAAGRDFNCRLCQHGFPVPRPVPTAAVPVRATPLKAVPIKATPVKATPVRATPVRALPVPPAVAKVVEPSFLKDLDDDDGVIVVHPLDR